LQALGSVRAVLGSSHGARGADGELGRTATEYKGMVDELAARISPLRLLAADEDQEALRQFADFAGELGHEVIATAVNLAEASEAIAREDPDASVVVVHEDDEHALALIDEIRAFARGPVIALVDNEEPAFVARAAERGIAAHARPTGPDALQSAIELAMRRHAEMERLETQVDQLQTALDRRAVIERAKGVLMERHGVDERGAFELLRHHARSTSQQVVAVADGVTSGRLDPGA
jgi:AmiR/NasT family two-component response regulator